VNNYLLLCVSGIASCGAGKRMSMKHRWNDTDSEKPKYLSQCLFNYNRSHMNGLGNEPGPETNI